MTSDSYILRRSTMCRATLLTMTLRSVVFRGRHDRANTRLWERCKKYISRTKVYGQTKCRTTSKKKRRFPGLPGHKVPHGRMRQFSGRNFFFSVRNFVSSSRAKFKPSIFELPKVPDGLVRGLSCYFRTFVMIRKYFRPEYARVLSKVLKVHVPSYVRRYIRR